MRKSLNYFFMEEKKGCCTKFFASYNNPLRKYIYFLSSFSLSVR